MHTETHFYDLPDVDIHVNPGSVVIDSYKPTEIDLGSGKTLTVEQCQDALKRAADIIEKVGTTGIEHEWPNAERWLRDYFPHKL